MRRNSAAAAFLLLSLSSAVALGAPADNPPYPGPVQIQRMEEEKEKLSKAISSAADDADAPAVGNALFDVIGTYGGDPATIFADHLDLLVHKSMPIRCVTAEAFLHAGFKREAAIAALMDLMNLPDKQMTVMQAKSIDCRTYAAKTLGYYGVKEAADGMWARYKEDQDDKLLFYLAELGDRRPLEAILPMLVKPSKAIRYADILGRLKCEEAKPALEKAGSTALDRFKAKRALYWITGDETYLDDLLSNYDRGSIAYLIQIKSPKVEALLKECLHSQKTLLAESAIVALHVNYPGTPEVRQLVVDYLQDKTMDMHASSELVFRIGVDLRDPEIDKMGMELDRKWQSSKWAPFLARRNFPFLDDRMRCE